MWKLKCFASWHSLLCSSPFHKVFEFLISNYIWQLENSKQKKKPVQDNIISFITLISLFLFAFCFIQYSKASRHSGYSQYTYITNHTKARKLHIFWEWPELQLQLLEFAITPKYRLILKLTNYCLIKAHKIAKKVTG